MTVAEIRTLGADFSSRYVDHQTKLEVVTISFETTVLFGFDAVLVRRSQGRFDDDAVRQKI